MGIADRKLRDKEDLNRKIIEAAEEILSSEGYSAVSIRKIAEKIEYSSMTIYRYFKNKSDIFKEIVKGSYIKMGQNIKEIVDKNHPSPLTTLNELIKMLVINGISNPNHYKLWNEQGEVSLNQENMEFNIEGQSMRIFHTWFIYINQCIEQKIFKEKNPQIIFQLIWINIQGLTSLLIRYPQYPWGDKERLIDEMLELLRVGLAPEKIDLNKLGE